MNAASAPGRLRQATWPLHHRLDHHPALACLLAQDLEANTYRWALTRLYPPQKALESALSQAQHLLPAHYTLATRTPDLEADLEALGMLPEPCGLLLAPSVDTPGLIGQLYVQEGARLGAAHIERALARLPARLPQSYFANAMGAARWPGFLALAEGLDDDGTERACQEACKVFQLFLDHMDAHIETCADAAGAHTLQAG